MVDLESLAKAFLNRGKGAQALLQDGCELINTLKKPLTTIEVMAVLGAVAEGADFSKCVERAARYIAVALANTPNASAVLLDRLKKLIMDFEAQGLHREAFLLAVSGAKSGTLGLLALTEPRSWAEEVIYVEVLSNYTKGAIDSDLHVDLGMLALGAIMYACRAGRTACRYAKAALLPRIAVSLVFEHQFDLAEEYLETALEAFEQLQQEFNVVELADYLDLLFPIGWDNDSVETVKKYLTLLVYSSAASVYRFISSEKMYKYIEEFYRRARGTQFELLAKVNWARFAYVFRRISFQDFAREVEKAYSDLVAKAFIGVDPAFASYIVKLYLLTLAASGRGKEALELYKAYAKSLKSIDLYAITSYMAFLGLLNGVEEEVRRRAALAIVPPDDVAECIYNNRCPPEPVLARRNDTAAALVLDYVTRGEWEEALKVVQRHTGTRDLKEAELWDALAVEIESRDREALKKSALDLLIYTA